MELLILVLNVQQEHHRIQIKIVVSKLVVMGINIQLKNEIMVI